MSPGGMVAGSLQRVIVGEALESTRMIQNSDFKEQNLDFYVRNAGKWFKTSVKLGGKTV